MQDNVPSVFITRLIPRRQGDGNLRGTFIGNVEDIRRYDNAADYRNIYDATVWNKVLTPEITLDFGQPPKMEYLTEQGEVGSILKPSVGDILLLVQGSRSPSGDGLKARRGLIGLAKVEDVHFYEGKNLNITLDPVNVNHSTWSSARCSLRASVLGVVDDFLIAPDQLRKSVYYAKSGLLNFESALGIGSTSSSANVTSFFSDTENNAERKQRLIYLLCLFLQFDPTFAGKLEGSSIEHFLPNGIEPIEESGAMNSPLNDTSSRNRIFFGSPGSGKSRVIRLLTQNHTTYSTTFHPDYEFSDLIGAYKPIEDDENPGQITYRFESGILIDAYVHAWKDPSRRVYVIIDELNRGNCAQIFGDLFQLLDRDTLYYSEYVLNVGNSLSKYLKREFSGTKYKEQIAHLYNLKQGAECANPFALMAFPPNLYLYATMNTSDQSLFPMDSAFKRRWDWEYVPIDYADADQIMIDLGNGFTYKWGRFIECVNRFIVELTGSEDKQLGNRFVNPPDKVIGKEMFKSKVLFYLWSEVYKNEKEHPDNIFVYQPADAFDTVAFSFSELFQRQADGTPLDDVILPSFMNQLGLPQL